MFKHIPDDEAVLVENGVFKQAKLYEYAGGLYAATKGGFVRLKANGATSHPSVRLETLARDGAIFQDQFGRLRVEAAEGSRRLSVTPDGSLKLLEDVTGKPNRDINGTSR